MKQKNVDERKRALKTLIMSMVFSFSLVQASLVWPAEEQTHMVKRGDNLWTIAQSYQVSLADLMRVNDLNSDLILPGQQLRIPYFGGPDYYVVQKGDNLWGIAQKYGMSVDGLMNLNNLTSSIIHPNQRLSVRQRGSLADNQNQSEPVFKALESRDKDTELYWLARAISSEARGEPLLGQIAVGAVLMNRKSSKLFPNDIYDIIFQRVNGVYQFTPAANGSIYKEPTPQSLLAARRALAGEDPTNGALFFYNPTLTASDNWITTRPVSRVLNNHVFAW